MPEREGSSDEESPGDPAPDELIEQLPAFLKGNSAESVFAYVSSHRRRKPPVAPEEQEERKNLAFITPPDLYEALSATLREQKLSKTQAFLAYVRVHVTLSEIFGTAGAEGSETFPLAEPTFSGRAPLRTLYAYATRRIAYPEAKAGNPTIAIQVPLELAQSFKSWAVRQGSPMTDVMIRYGLFHLHLYRQHHGPLPVPEDARSRWAEPSESNG